jgi:K+/H+ antiporter YhaU regulatory subunit KhtT
MLGSALYLWRAAGRMELQYQSGVEVIARALATPAPTLRASSARLSTPTLIPGLDRIETVRLAPSDQAVSQTLAQLNLRALTGATVLAIHREGEPAQVPSGELALRPHDLLALTGTQAAVELARRLLSRGRLDAAEAEADATLDTPARGGVGRATRGVTRRAYRRAYVTYVVRLTYVTYVATPSRTWPPHSRTDARTSRR